MKLHVSLYSSNCSSVSCSEGSSSSKSAENLLAVWKTGCGFSSYLFGSAGFLSRFSFLTPLPPPLSGSFAFTLSLLSPRSERIPLPLPLGAPPPSLDSLKSFLGPAGLPKKPFLSGDVGEVEDVTVILLLSTLISTLRSSVGLFGSVLSAFAAPVDAAFCCSIRRAHTFTVGGGAAFGTSLGTSFDSLPSPPRGLSRGGVSLSLPDIPSSLDLALSRRLLSRRSFGPRSPSLDRLLSRRARPLEPRGHSSRSRRSFCFSFSCFNLASSSSFWRASFSSISRSLAAVSTGFAPPKTELPDTGSSLVSSTGLVRGWS